MHLNRRHFLGGVGGAVLWAAGLNAANASSPDLFFSEIDTVILYGGVSSGNEYASKAIDMPSVVKDFATILSNALKDARPDIKVKFVNKRSDAWPEGHLMRATLDIFFRITIREFSSSDPKFNGYLGSIGLKIDRGKRSYGIQMFPTEAFLSPKNDEVLHTRILEALNTQIGRRLAAELRAATPPR